MSGPPKPGFYAGRNQKGSKKPVKTRDKKVGVKIKNRPSGRPRKLGVKRPYGSYEGSESFWRLKFELPDGTSYDLDEEFANKEGRRLYRIR